jgi:comEA protein
LYSKIKAIVAKGILVGLTCVLTGCSLSFDGFPVGERADLAFLCGESVSEEEDTEDPGTHPSEETVPETETEAAEETLPETETETAEEVSEEGTQTASEDTGKVNINSAGLEELMTLNGVGESRAKAIIEYREKNGPFQKEEDIMLIPGIKEGIFSKIREQIAVQ